MIEQDLVEYLTLNIPEVDWYWGQTTSIDQFESPIGNIFKVPSLTDNNTPSFLDNIQVTVRSNKIDTAQQYSNEVVELLQLYCGLIGTYRVSVPAIVINGSIYERDDIVSSSLTVSFKYTGI